MEGQENVVDEEFEADGDFIEMEPEEPEPFVPDNERPNYFNLFSLLAPESAFVRTGNSQKNTFYMNKALFCAAGVTESKQSLFVIQSLFAEDVEQLKHKTFKMPMLLPDGSGVITVQVRAIV